MRIIANDRGFAMPLALMVMLVVSLLSTALWQYSVTETKQVSSEESKIKAHYLARSGAESIAGWVVKDPLKMDDRVRNLISKTSSEVKLEDTEIPVEIKVRGNTSYLMIESTATVNEIKATVTKRLYRIPDLVAVGNDGMILTFDGTQWTRLTETIPNWTTKNLRGVTWGGAENDKKFVAVGDDGTILTTNSGDRWYYHESGISSQLNDVIWKNNLFIAVGNNGTILTSSDGVTWTKRTSGTSNNLHAITWGEPDGDGLFVAVGNNGVICVSNNGTSWSSLVLRDFRFWDWSYYNPELNDIAWGGSIFLMVSDNGYYYYSPLDDGSDSRVYRDRAGGDDYYCVAYGNNQFIATGESGSGAMINSNGRLDDNGQIPEINYDLYSIILHNTGVDSFWTVGDSDNIIYTNNVDGPVNKMTFSNVGPLNDITSTLPHTKGSWRIDVSS